MLKRRAVFLDRDGVVNHPVIRNGKSYSPQSIEEFELLPGVIQAVNSLRQAGFLIVIVTNQPDVSKGTQTREVIESMHNVLWSTLSLDDIKICFHVDLDGCYCRKPKPGMLFEAARELEIDLSLSFIVGDRWRDVAAGKSAGCYTFFIDYGYAEQRPDDPDAIVESLEEASQLILEGEQI
ncbi:MAG: HAD family hydrolase [Deltaproteobacteria bacterium]|nr:HAD family hydrolase [Deltaproteobacteria bacterium]